MKIGLFFLITHFSFLKSPSFLFFFSYSRLIHNYSVHSQIIWVIFNHFYKSLLQYIVNLIKNNRNNSTQENMKNLNLIIYYLHNVNMDAVYFETNQRNWFILIYICDTYMEVKNNKMLFNSRDLVSLFLWYLIELERKREKLTEQEVQIKRTDLIMRIIPSSPRFYRVKYLLWVCVKVHKK